MADIRLTGFSDGGKSTLLDELERRGHAVVELSGGSEPPRRRFDLGIFANMGRTWQFEGFCDRVVCVSHGIIEDERPLPGRRTFFVSEGVRDHWGGSGAILRQPIDLSFWRAGDAPRSGAVRFSYRDTPTICRKAAAALGMSFQQVRSARPNEAQKVLSSAALVFASGRAALEAMACGAPTVIYDHRSTYQGPLLDTDLRRQMANSYSGRGGVEPDLDMVVEAARTAWSNRDWVEEHHDVRRIVSELIE